MRDGARVGNLPRMTLDDLLAKYDRRVPRYTSYPTAPHFMAMAEDAPYRAWLAQLESGTKLSLYLHVPFCASLCLFCGCNTTVARQDQPLRGYTQTLLQEIDLIADAIGQRLPVAHVHWGGGTPTVLPPDCMVAISDKLRSRFAFEADTEIAVEVDPRQLSDGALDAIRTMGVRRASLGVQDFDPVVQKAIGREQSFETTASCASRLRSVGVTSLNLDLIYGLPHQTTESVAETADTALVIEPDRIAVFGYAHVPWMKKHQSLIPEAALPGPAARFAQREVAEQVIGHAGYQAIGLDHFARPEDQMAVAARTAGLRRNFQGYTTDDAPVLIGLGASSIGSLPQGYIQNETSVPKWRDAIRNGKLPVARGVGLTPEDRLRRDVIEQLMCHFTVNVPDVATAHGFNPDVLNSATPGLEDLARDGLVRMRNGTIDVTREGRAFVRAVAATFDTYLQAGATRHAAAI